MPIYRQPTRNWLIIISVLRTLLWGTWMSATWPSYDAFSRYFKKEKLRCVHRVAVVMHDVQVIGTHDGSFHCDEVLAISMLKMLPQYENALIVRTRNMDILNQCNIVVDVGAVFDAPSLRFDHHQRGFTDVFDGFSTKLSSAGLVYRHFGRDIIKSVLNNEVDDATAELFHRKIYKSFIEHIDAIDNGISVSAGELRYNISTTLSNRVGRFNPEWNESQSAEDSNKRFVQAMEVTCEEFVSRVHGLAYHWWPARSIVADALKNRFEVHASGQILQLSHFCPWKDHLFELEAELSLSAPIIYVLYEDTSGSWRIQAVPQSPESFESRKKLPAPWCGVRDDALSEVAGIPDCVFAHASGFIGGNRTKEGCLAMANKALTFEPVEQRTL